MSRYHLLTFGTSYNIKRQGPGDFRVSEGYIFDVLWCQKIQFHLNMIIIGCEQRVELAERSMVLLQVGWDDLTCTFIIVDGTSNGSIPHVRFAPKVQAGPRHGPQ